MNINLIKNLVHNMEELAELIQALSKWVRGQPDFRNINEEIEHVEYVLRNLKENLKERG